MEPIKANVHQLPSYEHALKRGWSPDTLRKARIDEELGQISRNPMSFVDSFEDPEGLGGPVTLPDGSQATRLPGIKRWVWKKEFCGIMGLRWQPGTEALPAHCLGHIGYSVVPWRRNEGLASAALTALLPEARSVGLAHVDITTDPENIPSIRVIENAGGEFIQRFQKPESLGSLDGLLYRVVL